MQDLKLIALDAEDLAVLSTHLQDAVLRVGDMTYQKREKRFALIANRFDWEDATKKGDRARSFVRRRTGLRFERVLGAKVAGLDLSAAEATLALLSIVFETTSEPAGFVTLRFSGGSMIRLDVECIEAELTDLGAAWTTHAKPEHVGGQADDE
jgi:hypothetical protein